MTRTRTTTETITFDGDEIVYQLVRSPNRRKTISLSVDPELGRLKLLVPSRTDKGEIERIIRSRAQWIRDVQQRTASSRQPRNWDEGEKIQLRGELVLVVLDRLPASDQRNAAVTQRSLDGKELRILLPADATGARREPAIVDAIRRWYRQEAESHLPIRTENWLPPFRSALIKRDIYRPETDDVPPLVKISNAMKRWGSVGTRLVRCEFGDRRVINLSWHLMQVPDHLADYIIVHELAHLKEMNHQSAFWLLVRTMLPDWRERRKELGKWGRERTGV